ncbi:MAG TPA: translocation/assembly module TamB domain-containing protein [Steroidobacteraceae bacterium]|nr:translocation/assembly module TamB domain-containing protein [Steroidobacteraceae bacterium]
MRRAVKIAAWAATSLLTVLLVVVAAAWIAGNTNAGRAWIERSVARLSSNHVRLAGLSGSFPSAVDLATLQLADEHGVWLTAEHVSLRWSPLALLARRLAIDRLELGRLVIERRPAGEPRSTRHSSPSLPRVDIARLSIAALELAPGLAGLRASLTAQGTAHIRSVRDAAAQLTLHRIDSPGDYVLDLRSGAQRIDASIHLVEPADGALANLLGMPGLGAVAVDATLQGPRRAGRLNIDAHAGALQALAQGSLDLVQRTGDLVYRMDAPAMAPRADLSWESLRLYGRWQGSLASPHATAQLRIERLQLPQAGGLSALDASVKADGARMTAEAVAKGLVLPGPEPRLLADSPLRAQATMLLNEDAHPWQLTVEHRLFSLRTSGVSGQRLHATFALRLPELAPFAALAAERASGRAQLQGTVEGSGSDTQLEMSGDLELATGATLMTSILAGRSHIELKGRMSAGSVDIERLALTGANLEVSAQGDAQRGTAGERRALRSIRARYAANLKDMQALSPALGGTLALTGEAEGPIRSLSARLQLTSRLSVRQRPAETLKASLEAQGLPSRPSATLEAQGHLAGAPLALDASLERAASGAFHIAVRRAEWKSARMEGDLTTGAHLTPGRGQLRFSMARLEDLESLLGASIKGSLAGNLALRPVSGRTHAEGELAAKGIAAGGVQGDASLTVWGPPDGLALHLKARSPNLGGQPVDFDGAARLDVAARALRLEQVEAHYRGQTLRLLAPARVVFAHGIAIERLRLGMQKAVLEVSGTVSPALDVQASVHQVDAALIDAFAPGVLAQGHCDAEARLRGTTGAPTGIVTLAATGLRPIAAQDLPPADLHATAHLEERSVRLDARLTAGRDSQIALTGTMPLGEGALDLRVTGKVQAALLDPLLEARGDRLTGMLTLNATVIGAARSPQLAGTADLLHGDLRDYVRGVHLSNITAHLSGSEAALRLETLTARAGGGEMSATGRIGVLEPKLPVSLHLTARKAQPIASDILTANLDADLEVDGTLRERIDLAGTINVNRAVIGIPNALPPQVAVLDVRRPGQAPPPAPQRRLIVGLDVRLHAPREILVQGRGLNAELGGDLHITGTTAAPSVSGGFEMMRGTFALASTKLSFSSGKVSFNGAGLNGRIDPTLDFTASTTSADATTTLHIGGLADAPQFSLSSSPPLPQDEILARLLFGESASQLTALQVAQIGAALASLSGVGGSGPNPLVRVQKALGLDVLSVGGATNTAGTAAQGMGATVEAGRYVSNRVFVAAKQSTTGYSQVEVDVDLSRHLKLETRLGNGTATAQGTTPENDPGSSIGMSYQFQY